MTGHDFLVAADLFADGTTEAEWRSAVSRAYYAAFHVARLLFQSLGFSVPRADAAHKYLAFRLQNCGHSELEQAGRELDALRYLRNQADYDLSPSCSQQHAKAQVDFARAILKSLDLATVEPTRTQMRNAIIAYERTVLGQVTWKPSP
jgi:uncharacterized protein (UPF0332 family)